MRAAPTDNRTFISILMIVLVLGSGCTGKSTSGEQDGSDIHVLRVPDDGIQPVVEVDQQGTVHMIYFKGDPAAGNIYYVHREPGEKTFSQPVRVNSQPGSVIATGTVRGAHLALGQEGRLHVAWMGSSKAEPKGPGGATPMLYTRSEKNGAEFEVQRNVMQFATGLDGGGTVTTDRSGNVYVLWHAGAGKEGEENRRVWMAQSGNGGDSFSREVSISPPDAGACGCCGMKAAADAQGHLYALFRGAESIDQRDVYLLASRDSPTQVSERLLAKWAIGRCPMSTFDIDVGRDSLAISWENEEQIAYTVLESGQLQDSRIIRAPGTGENRKHPAVAMNEDGQVLVAWTEGTGWQEGGSLHWQLFDSAGNPLSENGSVSDGIPAWSRPDVIADSRGGFTIVH